MEQRDWNEFEVSSPKGGRVYRCRFQTLATGISPRHSDTLDVKFLVDGTPIVLALPHAAFAEHLQKTGRSLTDRDAIRIAALSLKQLLERGERLDVYLLALTPEETLQLAGNPSI